MEVRNQKAEQAWTTQQEIYRYRKKGEKKPKRKILPETWTTKIKSDALLYADDLTTKTNGAHEIYPKLTIMETIGKEHHIDINWDKIKIIYKEHHHSIYGGAGKILAPPLVWSRVPQN